MQTVFKVFPNLYSNTFQYYLHRHKDLCDNFSHYSFKFVYLLNLWAAYKLYIINTNLHWYLNIHVWFNQEIKIVF